MLVVKLMTEPRHDVLVTHPERPTCPTWNAPGTCTCPSSGEALVCMTPGGQASVVGKVGKTPLSRSE